MHFLDFERNLSARTLNLRGRLQYSLLNMGKVALVKARQFLRPLTYAVLQRHGRLQLRPFPS